jgi:hypothetical protein
MRHQPRIIHHFVLNLQLNQEYAKLQDLMSVVVRITPRIPACLTWTVQAKPSVVLMDVTDLAHHLFENIELMVVWLNLVNALHQSSLERFGSVIVIHDI